MRRPFRSVLGLPVVGLAALCVAVASCGGSSGGASGKPPDETSPVLRVGVLDSGGRDPALAVAPDAALLADLLYDTLVDLDPATSEPLPGLAVEWTPNDDLTEYTFTLADDATFHDGTPVTAADVKASLERVADPGVESPLTVNLVAVEGYGAVRAGDTSELSGVTTPNDATVVIALSAPFAELPETLAHPGFGVLPASVANDGDPTVTPIGSGPFEVADPHETDPLRLVRFDDHVSQPAALDAVEVTRFDDTKATTAAFEAGDIDLASGPIGGDPDSAPVVARGPGTVPYVAETLLALNLRGFSFDDDTFREAIVRAVDRGRVAASAADAGVRALGGLIPAGVPGASDNACTGVCSYDPAAAKKLVDEAFPDGDVPELALDYFENPVNNALVLRIAAQLDEIGVPIAARPHPRGDYAAFLASGDADLFLLGWVGDAPTAGSFLAPLFRSTSGENVIGVDEPEVDLLLAKAQMTADPAERAALYRDAERAVLATHAVLPLIQFETRFLVADTVENLAVDALGTIDAVAVDVTRAL
ncbi:MAG: ABC transporter substrate-binding protein [Acidimicrobiia bacterium]|nr:ABC transporter substrate-binding protein [Acidimicrobiia bacterium]